MNSIVSVGKKNAITYYGLYNQGFTDGSCQVAQIVAAPTTVISTSYQYGGVDTVKMKAGGTVGAGTMVQGSAIGSKLKSAKAAGVTLTGSGAIWACKFTEAIDAIAYKNLTCSFQVKVKHDVGSAINYYAYLNKADSADNFSAVTNIATSSARSIADATETILKFEGVAMGDCSNGIQAEVKSDCGAVTTKNFEFTDWQINVGGTITAFQPEDYNKALLNTQRALKEIAPEGSYHKVSNAGAYPVLLSVPLVPKMRSAGTTLVYNMATGAAIATASAAKGTHWGIQREDGSLTDDTANWAEWSSYFTELSVTKHYSMRVNRTTTTATDVNFYMKIGFGLFKDSRF